ncbi:hypothetical protein MMG03_001102 [Fibrobacter succinogenes]|nr:hypothetical protein [Fibrobacter succinogenes]
MEIIIGGLILGGFMIYQFGLIPGVIIFIGTILLGFCGG